MPNEFVYAKGQIMTVISNVPGVNQAPINANDTQNIFPFAIGYLSTGELGVGPIGTRKSLYNVTIDLLTKTNNLSADLELLDPFVDSIPLALLQEVSDNGDKFSNTISTFDRINIQYIPLVDYSGVSCRGYRFIMVNVKILSNT